MNATPVAYARIKRRKRGRNCKTKVLFQPFCSSCGERKETQLSLPVDMHDNTFLRVHGETKESSIEEPMAKSNELTLNQELAREAQSIVAPVFRNSPIEEVHGEKECPACSGTSEYSHITQAEMKRIMKRAVDKLHALLWIRAYSAKVYECLCKLGIASRVSGIELMTRLAELLEGERKARR